MTSVDVSRCAPGHDCQPVVMDAPVCVEVGGDDSREVVGVPKETLRCDDLGDGGQLLLEALDGGAVLSLRRRRIAASRMVPIVCDSDQEARDGPALRLAHASDRRADPLVDGSILLTQRRGGYGCKADDNPPPIACVVRARDVALLAQPVDHGGS